MTKAVKPLPEQKITLTILSDHPRTVLEDATKYWLFVRDRQIKVKSVTVKGGRRET